MQKKRFHLEVPLHLMPVFGYLVGQSKVGGLVAKGDLALA